MQIGGCIDDMRKIVDSAKHDNGPRFVTRSSHEKVLTRARLGRRVWRTPKLAT